VETEESITDEN